MTDHANAIEHLRGLNAARRLHFRAFVMTEPRTTAEYNTEELMALIATSACNDRITARMPAVTLDELLRPGPPAYATGGTTALPVRTFPRMAVIAISCALTVIVALGLAAAI
jgi:hypothetical protein